jgi:hypothetical protein
LGYLRGEQVASNLFGDGPALVDRLRHKNPASDSKIWNCL